MFDVVTHDILYSIFFFYWCWNCIFSELVVIDDSVLRTCCSSWEKMAYFNYINDLRLKDSTVYFCNLLAAKPQFIQMNSLCL